MTLTKELNRLMNEAYAENNEDGLLYTIERLARGVCKHDPDMTQEVANHAWKRLILYDANRGAKLSTWVTKVIRNKAMDIWRQKAAIAKRGKITQSTREVSWESLSDDELLNESIPIPLVGRWLAFPDPRTETALYMWLEGKPKAEIAKFLGVAQGSVDVTLHRMRKKVEIMAA